jgi:succinate dehydrogenase/fumarate reductase cytochrome b subunit
MNQAIKKKAFNRRAFVSIVIFLSGMTLPISGLMNHSLQLQSLTKERHFWMSLHNVAALLFTAFLIVHIFYNWRALTNYMKRVKEASLSKEMIVALILVITCLGIVTLHVFH